MNGPLVSVLVPVLNEERYIKRALLSLHNQTYRNFEVVLVDDGCTDGTIEIAQHLGLENLTVVKGPGLGLARALETGVNHAQGEIIFRQDADDFSLPKRLERQLAFLQSNPNCVAVGTWAAVFDEKGTRCATLKAPVRDGAIRLRLTLEVGFAHASMAMRKSAVIACGNYQGVAGRPYPEDFDLWSRLQFQGLLANIPEVLVGTVTRSSGITQSNRFEIGKHAGAIAARNMTSFVGEGAPSHRLVMLVSRFYVPGGRIAFADCVYIWKWLLEARYRAGIREGLGGYRAIHYLKPLAWALDLRRLRKQIQ